MKTELEVDFDLILPKLFLGTHRAAKSHAFHKRLNIAAVLNVKQEDISGELPRGCRYMHVPILDEEGVSLEPYLAGGVRFIDQYVQDG
jgi:protein-tyrosine phosphatase